MPGTSEAKTRTDALIRRTCFGEEGDGAIRMATLDKERHTAEFVIATSQPVRDNPYGPPTSLVMKQGSVILKDYRSNPVILAQHEHGLPQVIGRSLKVWQEDGNLIALAQFDAEDKGLGEMTWGKIERGFIRAASIGFRTIRTREIEEGQTDAETGLKGPVRLATQWRLYEWSVVAVGADSGSLGRSGEESPEPDAGESEGAADDGDPETGRFVLPMLPVFRLF